MASVGEETKSIRKAAFVVAANFDGSANRRRSPKLRRLGQFMGPRWFDVLLQIDERLIASGVSGKIASGVVAKARDARYARSNLRDLRRRS